MATCATCDVTFSHLAICDMKYFSYLSKNKNNKKEATGHKMQKQQQHKMRRGSEQEAVALRIRGRHVGKEHVQYVHQVRGRLSADMPSLYTVFRPFPIQVRSPFVRYTFP